MRWWRKLRDDRKDWEKWNAELVWYRLRYEDASAPRRVIEWLSRPQTAGRVAIYFRPGPDLSRLYVGIPRQCAQLLQRMAQDLAFSARLAGTEIVQQARPMVPTSTLPWDRAFVAQIVDGCAFADNADASTDYLPQPVARRRPAQWYLPAPPSSGMALRPSWNGHLTTGGFADDDARKAWPLGYRTDGVLLFAPGPVNLYGRRQAIAAWLVQLISHMLADGPGPLLVIDGAGDVVPVLKRKALVTERLGRGLTYVDIDGAVVAGGFNPLAPVPGETELVSRWQEWFAAMDVHPDSLPLLALAREEGVGDIAALERWLARPERQPHLAQAKGLRIAIRRLMADDTVREWLAWPTNCFTGIDTGVLLFACRRDSWARDQLLHAGTLATAHVQGAHTILHGLSWVRRLPATMTGRNRLLLTNGPLQSKGTIVLTGSDPAGAQTLTRRFLNDEAQYEENLQLLQEDEAVAVFNEAIVPLSWQDRSTGGN